MFAFLDIAIGSLMLSDGSLVHAVNDYWTKNSAGDVIDMLMQALDRDASVDNFLSPMPIGAIANDIHLPPDSRPHHPATHATRAPEMFLALSN
ncbi:hypothetical protein Hypma_003723 [Hypsizygus marmoreus]|uniref:Uncharacterized protein n=1 Tax=Hypsizygus marmoreus TaxID=39966 RepID=A0A369JA76_HYPMA|nr:hypothetical protein Hypma_003723 [Hypsizygus marmoreus]